MGVAGKHAWDPARPGAAVRIGESVYSPALGEAVCARAAAGESLTAICETSGMPERHTLGNWARAYPEFGQALRAAMRRARAAERLADRAALAARPGAGRLGSGPPGSGRRVGRPSTYRVEVGRAICERLADGETLTSIGRDPEMPCFGTILAWVKRNPEFEEMYIRARELFCEQMFDEARDVALASTHASVWSDRLRFDVIRWMTARMAPKKYCERLVVDAGVAARRAEDAASDPGRAPMTVIVKRFCDVTPEEEAAADATEAWYEGRDRGRGR